MSAIKIISEPREFHPITFCPRCHSTKLKIISNTRRRESWDNNEMINSNNISTDVDIHCKDCNCLVHYRE